MVRLDLSHVDDATLMDLWDDAQSRTRPWRELAVLAGCCGEAIDTLAGLPLGERDRLLLAVRLHLFGDRVEAESRCADCGERLDLSFDIGDMIAPRAADSPATRRLEARGVRVRALTSADVAAVLGAADPEPVLLGRCVEHDPAAAADALHDPALQAEIAAALEEADPGAETILTVRCPWCDAARESVFDPAAFLLAELGTYAARLVGEVDQLARAYGWPERDILALGPRRRRRYLERTS
jgi:hypothetical protein